METCNIADSKATLLPGKKRRERGGKNLDYLPQTLILHTGNSHGSPGFRSLYCCSPLQDEILFNFGLLRQIFHGKIITQGAPQTRTVAFEEPPGLPSRPASAHAIGRSESSLAASLVSKVTPATALNTATGRGEARLWCKVCFLASLFRSNINCPIC